MFNLFMLMSVSNKAYEIKTSNGVVAAAIHDLSEFGPRGYFKLTTRNCRVSVATKGAIHLRGPGDVLGYITQCDGIEIDWLFVGKIALHHIPAINDLMRQCIVKKPGFAAKILDVKRDTGPLECCTGKSVFDVLKLCV